MAIPRVLHQLWKTAEIPDRFTVLRETWRARNPHWSFRLWTDHDLEALVDERFPQLANIYRGYALDICRADLGRYLVLETFGGIYADLDCECLAPLDDLLDGAELLLAPEPQTHLTEDMRERSDGLEAILCPSFLASVPAHPLWAHVRRRIAESAEDDDVLNRTGPFLLTRAVADARAEGASITVAPSALIYPFDKAACWSGEAFEIATWERLTRGALVAHYWDGSWFRRATPFDGFPHNLAVSINRTDGPRATFPADAAEIAISCIMPLRRWDSGAALAVESFLRQNHPNRELLIVADHRDPEIPARLAGFGRPGLRLIVQADRTLSDLELERLGLAHATADLVCAWRPGELSDPRRLEVHLQVMQQTGALACVNLRGLAWRPNERRAAVIGQADEPTSMLQLKALAWSSGGLRTPPSETTIATIDLPRLTLAVNPDPSRFEAIWAASAARFEADRCDAVIEDLGKRLPVSLARSAPTGRKSRSGAAARSAIDNEILILTPIKNGRCFLPRYLELVSRLESGGAPLSIAFLEGDSRDGTFEALEAAAPSLKALFRRVELHRHHEGFQSPDQRWTPSHQRQRRAVIARARNRLLSAALGRAAWVLWLDADVIDYPADLLCRLLATGKDIVVPHCVDQDGRSFDLNTFAFAPESGGRDDPGFLVDGLFQPPRGAGRLYLEDLTDRDLVRVDAVGGTALLIRGDLHRQGLNFPAYSHGGYIETEGLAMVARDMGHDCWALPNLLIRHPAEAPAPAARGAADAGPVADRGRRIEAALRVVDEATREPADLPPDDPVFVCAVGWRCGSTLVQRILMTDPTIAIWGEPLDRTGALNRLTDLISVLQPDWPPPDHWYTHRPSVDLARDWIANLSPDAGDFKAALRGMLDTWLATPARRRGFARWGVKEVRWSSDQARVLRWLYPQSRFVIVTRHPTASYVSMSHLGLSPGGPGFWARWPDQHIRTLDDYGRYWNALATSWSTAATALGASVVRYEDLVAGRVDLHALGGALGLRLQPELALAARVGADPHTQPVPAADIARLNALTAEGRRLFQYDD